MKKAFTLAEVLITLTVIGIITAVIIPVAIHSKPDENIMKFKKAHNTLFHAISTLINSDEYYLDGDLGVAYNGVELDGSRGDSDTLYFCKTFSDVLATKKINCSTSGILSNTDGTVGHVGMYWNFSELDSVQSTKPQEYVDEACKKSASVVGEEIMTPDNIVYYQENPKVTFGIYVVGNKSQNFTLGTKQQGLDNKVATARLFSGFRDYPWNDRTFDNVYKIFCIDIDGINNGEEPFGYGIRSDGKILVGAKATEWLEKSIQN